MAEALLRQTLDVRAITAEVSSAGLLFDGEPATATAVETMAARGLDLSGHRSRVISPEMVGTPDLIITMAREHLREVVIRRPDRYGRTFTLREFVRRGDEVGPRAGGEPIDAWLGRMHTGRTPSELQGASPLDDIADPIGRGLGIYGQTAAELAVLVTRLADLLWEPVPVASEPVPGRVDRPPDL